MSHFLVCMYFRIHGRLKNAEIKTTENFRILFDSKTAKIYTHRNIQLYVQQCIKHNLVDRRVQHGIAARGLGSKIKYALKFSCPELLGSSARISICSITLSSITN